MRAKLWFLFVLSLAVDVVAAQEAPSPTVPTEPGPTPEAQAPSAEPPAPDAEPPQPSAPPAPDGDVGPPDSEDAPQIDPAPTTPPEAGEEGGAEASEATVLPSSPSDDSQDVVERDAEARTAFVCVWADPDVPDALECTSVDGTQTRFQLVDAGAGPEVFDHGLPMSGPVDVGFISSGQAWPFFLVVGIIGGGATAWTLSANRPSKPSPVVAAQEFLRVLQRGATALPPSTATPSRLESLVERAIETPDDAQVQLDLAMELFDRGESDVALRMFERAIHLRPEILVGFLEDPRYAQHRDRDDVRAVMRNVWRDRERRFTGYV